MTFERFEDLEIHVKEAYSVGQFNRFINSIC